MGSSARSSLFLYFIKTKIRVVWCRRWAYRSIIIRMGTIIVYVFMLLLTHESLLWPIILSYHFFCMQWTNGLPRGRQCNKCRPIIFHSMQVCMHQSLIQGFRSRAHEGKKTTISCCFNFREKKYVPCFLDGRNSS